MTVVAGRLMGGRGRLPAFVELIGRAVAAIRVALGEQPIGVGAVDVEPLRLTVRRVRSADVGALVVIDAEPPQILEHAGDGFLGDPARVGVLEPQDELAAVVAGEEPREQRAPHVADVQRPARRGREAAADRRVGHRTVIGEHARALDLDLDDVAGGERTRRPRGCR